MILNRTSVLPLQLRDLWWAFLCCFLTFHRNNNSINWGNCNRLIDDQLYHLANTGCIDRTISLPTLEGDILCSFSVSAFYSGLLLQCLKHISVFSHCPVQHWTPPLSETLRFSSRLFKAPPPEGSAHQSINLLWLVSWHMPEPAPLTTRDHLAESIFTLIIQIVSQCDVTESQHKKARLLTRRFRSSVFCGSEELLVVRASTFWTFKKFETHKYKTLKDRK